MRMTTERSSRGKHRKITTSQTTKGRIALVTVATGAVSTAGIGGAAAAQIQAQNNEVEATVAATPEYELAANASDLGTQIAEAAPQILAIAEHKPADYIQQQLTTAVQFAGVRAEQDKALRAPSVVKPAEGAFTSGFGPRWGTLHAGIDIANAVGTPILAVMDGVVVDSGPASGYGNWIRIQHEDGTISLYGHMETLDVVTGDHVTAGQKIAGMGNRGFSTGSHLHFEIHPGGAGAVDPVPWFAERGVTI
ncbi:M23 family metallopeptidase [Corynebacterium sp.]|uniref:M23 family metallopeptidase n=1 Tax=Corynebacterium sp. TaxID=1720 RepID=UPI0026DF0141|nr:M23 family metallopeptidase [Corynebacterium sp.]MDO5513084.1 M23 family metallopeptidase [Corynebacterium sp.]